MLLSLGLESFILLSIIRNGIVRVCARKRQRREYCNLLVLAKMQIERQESERQSDADAGQASNR